MDHDPQDDSPVVLARSEDDVESSEHLAEMHRVHLTKLADYGFINWNRETHEVTKGSEFDEIKPPLELLADNEDELSEGWSSLNTAVWIIEGDSRSSFVGRRTGHSFSRAVVVDRPL